MPTAGRQSASRVNKPMRAISCTLLCSSLLIHAALGCCWHDKHDGDTCGGASGSLAEDAHSGHDHDGATNGHDSHAPCKGHPNCHGLCHYLPVQKTNFDKCLIHVPIDFTVDVQAMCGSQVATLPVAPGTCEFCAPPPIRLHLFHQILLI